jgi:hypothetical protein
MVGTLGTYGVFCSLFNLTTTLRGRPETPSFRRIGA